MYSLREKMLDKQQNDVSHYNYRTTVYRQRGRHYRTTAALGRRPCAPSEA